MKLFYSLQMSSHIMRHRLVGRCGGDKCDFHLANIAGNDGLLLRHLWRMYRHRGKGAWLITFKSFCRSFGVSPIPVITDGGVMPPKAVLSQKDLNRHGRVLTSQERKVIAAQKDV